MVVVEHILRNIINQIPIITVNNIDLKASFHWGTQKELNKYLTLKKENAYPLVWLVSPGIETHYGGNNSIVDRQCKFVIAYRELRKDMLNDERYIANFDVILNPLASYLIQGLQNSGVTRLENNEITIVKHPDYTDESKGNKTPLIDLLDALTIECDVVFNSNFCIQDIKWLNQ